MRRRLRAQLARALAHPVTFLLGINVACGLIGLAQLAYLLVVLRPADFAVIGVLAATAGVIMGLLDARLADLTTRLFFAVPKAEPARRGALLAASLALHAAVGLAATALTVAAAMLLAPRLLATVPPAWWMAAAAARLATSYPLAALTTPLRLLGAFQTAGWLRLAAQAIATLATVGGIWVSPGLAGYFGGALAGTMLGLGLTATVAAREVRRALGTPLLAMPGRTDLAPFLASGRFLAGSSLAGLAKLLGRSCDVLLVASLGSDTTTGLYRVARQGFDTLAGLSDAVSQFYTPTIVDCIQRRRWDDLRRHRGRLILLGLAAAVTAVAGSWLVLRPLAAAFAPLYAPALPAFEVFALLLAVTIGIHGWLWPMLVAAGRLWWFGVFGIAGAAAQLGAMAALGLWGQLDATSAALTALLMAAVNYGPFLAERVLRRLRAARPGPSA